ncbi:MAG: hypothetical protein IKX40_00860 [Thermoguttaceae bacterium]|nr:hypothetical protein [Thermoguttaceae bacterium]
MSLNKDSLKNFFVNHTEKVIFGFFVLGFLLMVWGGFSLKPLSISQSQFESSVKNGRQKLDNSEPDVSQYTSIDYEKEAELSAKSISPQALSLLEMNNNFRHPIAQPQVKRTQPPVLSVTALQVSSGVGFCPEVRNDMSSSPRSGQTGKTQLKLTPGVRWVVVTALIPNLEQEKRFFETFRNSDVKYPDSDRPSYYSFYVEREEITNSGSQGWKPLDVKESFQINKRYSGGSGNEVVDQEFIAAQPTPIASSAKKPEQASSLPVPVSMAMPLMNLSKHQWGADCAHLPEIPIVSLASRNDEQLEDELEAPVTPVEGTERDKPQAIPTYKLFRFFDTKVEGGKQYRYRIKLVLKNPNYNVKSEYVESEAITVNPFIEGDWSQPSPVAEVPLDTRIYCIGARTERPSQTAPKLDDFAGPLGQLMILKFDEVKGLEISKNLNKDNAQPGMVLNFYNTDFNNQSEDSFREQPGVANFVTNDVVLDFSSKTKQTGALFKGLPMPPARALLMSQDGKVFVLSEDKDKSVVYLKSTKPDMSSSSSSIGRGGPIEEERPGRQTTPKRNTRPAADDSDGIYGH